MSAEGTKIALKSLYDATNQDLTSIEIIPGDWTDWIDSAPPGCEPSITSPLLLVEWNLGVPQKVLYRLYLASANFSHINSVAIPHAKTVVETTLQKTTCILIVNPAHQTALNTRKNLIADGNLDARKELRFVELLLVGVKACAKESALWAHRRWCLSRLHGFAYEHFDSRAKLPSSALPPFSDLTQSVSSPFLPSDAIRTEFATVRQAFTLYPRNYHAWTHWHQTFDLCCAIIGELSMIVLEEIRGLRKWIDAHITDFSAVHHLVTSLPKVRELLSSQLFSPEVCELLETESSPSELAKQSWGLLSSFLPHKETQWLFLVSILPSLPPLEQEGYIQRMLDLDVPWEMHRKHFVATYVKSS
ncbi:hypothetical protein DFP72DRAFT_883594 [Ephemerocybe angulata]|uniref:Protein prenylyltransferase n=1 Tax=Ephemerocybe angulata TaxID=980116 RepID=A0A8H6M8X2_9AGAR|nr:hypothetical protein DFP72DRAFT_883594 [Tulosesus angulatus]